MRPLTGAQRRQLRKLAHGLQPIVLIGKQGVTEQVMASIDENLTAHELIKVRFVDRKREKKVLAAEIAERSESHLAGLVGHVAILYREHPDPKRRRVSI